MSTELPTAELLPDELASCPQWLCWREQKRDGKATKIPIDPTSGNYASATDPLTWVDFETARAYAETGDALGVGFVFTDDDPFVGVDLDDCRIPETETVLNWAEEVVNTLDSYTEISPSGTGFHVIVNGELPGDRNRKGSVELYETARFFTVTGDHVEGTPAEVCERQDSLEVVHAEHIAPDETEGEDESSQKIPTGSVDLEDKELLSKARNAKNGEKFSRLWRGNTSGYESQSEADMALCSLLAFWTGGESSRIDRLFRDSGLMREKWDEVHFSDSSTYGEKTVERAISGTSEFYEPKSVAEKSATALDVTPTENSRTHSASTACETERIETLHGTIENLNARIQRLESENTQFKEALEEERSRRRESEARLSDDGSDSNSVLVRVLSAITPE